MTRDELDEVLRLHKLWLIGEEGGKRANLSAGVLSVNSNLREACLMGAYMFGACLVGSDFSGADLTSANIGMTDMGGVDLRRAKGIIRIGPSQDGFEFCAVRRNGVVWINGCRLWATASDTRAYWQERLHGTQLGAERMRFIDFLETNCPE